MKKLPRSSVSREVPSNFWIMARILGDGVKRGCVDFSAAYVDVGIGIGFRCVWRTIAIGGGSGSDGSFEMLLCLESLVMLLCLEDAGEGRLGLRTGRGGGGDECLASGSGVGIEMLSARE